MKLATYNFTPEELEQMYTALRYRRLWMPMTDEEENIIKSAEAKIKAYLEA